MRAKNLPLAVNHLADDVWLAARPFHNDGRNALAVCRFEHPHKDVEWRMDIFMHNLPVLIRIHHAHGKLLYFTYSLPSRCRIAGRVETEHNYSANRIRHRAHVFCQLKLCFVLSGT